MHQSAIPLRFETEAKACGHSDLLALPDTRASGPVRNSGGAFLRQEFRHLYLSDIVGALGLDALRLPRPIQMRSSRLPFGNETSAAGAPTGSGRTLAFGVPMVNLTVTAPPAVALSAEA